MTLSALLCQSAHAIGTVAVMADTSISVAMVEVARRYSRDRNVVVNASFVSPQEQEAQIKEGGAADILVTPLLPWVEKLKTEGLVDIYSQSTVARNRLVLAGPVDGSLTMLPKQTLRAAPLINAMDWEQAFVVGNPETQMAGVYGKEALRSLKVAADLEPYTLYIKDAQEMFDMVATHHAYGIFLNSSVANRNGVRVINMLPESSHQPINYYAVVIAGENMDEARRFLEYLKGSQARRLLRANGFMVD